MQQESLFSETGSPASEINSLLNKRIIVDDVPFRPYYAPHWEDGVVVLRLYEGATEEERALARQQAHELARMHSGKKVYRDTHRFHRKARHGKLPTIRSRKS